MSHSIDHRVTQDLVTTLTDGHDGYLHAAERIDSPGAATLFRRFAAERKAMADRLVGIATRYDDDVEADGSTLATAHRTWMSLKDAVTSSDVENIVETCITGEDHALSTFQDALGEQISEPLRSIVQEQLDEIQQAKATLQSHVVSA